MSETSHNPFPSGEMIEAIKDLAVRAAGVSISSVWHPSAGTAGVPAAIPVAIKHGEQPSVESVADLFERYRTRPVRKSGIAKALTLQSLIDLTQRHQTEHTAVFADTNWRQPSITAVIDYHEIDQVVGDVVPEGADPTSLDAALADDVAIEPGAPAFGKHRIHYAFPLSEEWQAWVKQDGKPMEQADFAAFIEDHIAELSAPTDAERIWLERDFQTMVATPAQLIQLSRGLQVNINAVVKNVVTLQSGEGQVTFDEQHVGSDGKPLKVPGLFVLNIAPFFMGTAISIPVRLRYRPAGGKVVWFYQIYRPDEHITGRIRADLRKVAEETGLPAYEGSPEMPA